MDAVDQMAIIEAAANFADLAATFRDALVERDFAEAPAELTALQMAAHMVSGGLQPK